MRSSEHLKAWILESSRVRFLAALLAITLWRSGLWEMPNLEQLRAVAVHPFANPFVGTIDSYVYGTWLDPFVMWGLHLNSPSAYLVVHLVLAVTFWFAFAAVAQRELGEESSRYALMAFCSLPVSGTAFFWIGPDSVTLLLLLLLVIGRRHWLVVLTLGLLLGVQHAEQASVALAVWMLSALLRRGGQGREEAAHAAGALLAVMVSRFMFGALGFFSIGAGDRVAFVTRHTWRILEFSVPQLPLTLLGLLGLGWAVVLVGVRGLSHRREFVLPLALCAVVSLFTLDVTRVFALTSFVLLCRSLLLDREVLQRVIAPHPERWVLALILVPFLWFGTGRMFGGMTGLDLLLMAQQWLPHLRLDWAQVSALFAI